MREKKNYYHVMKREIAIRDLFLSLLLYLLAIEK